MNNKNDNEWKEKNISVQRIGMRHTQFYHEKTPSLESSLIVKGSSTRQSNFNSSNLKAMNQLFKVPGFDNIPVRKSSVKSVLSPRRRVQTGRVKNDTKINQQMKMSFIPHPSLMNPRKSLMCSRTNHMNSRKELIKKMVFLAECSQNENIFKPSTPVKLPTDLTPRKTPKSKGYLALPEFKKMGLKIDMGTPIQDIVSKKPTASYSLTLFGDKNDSNLNPNKENKSDDSRVDLESSFPDESTVLGQILYHCRTYNREFHSVYGRLKILEDSFETKIKNLSDYLVYDEFCHYQSEKEKLYKNFKLLEERFRNSVKSQTHVGKKFNEYLKERGEFFQKREAIHNKFEDIVESLWEKSKTSKEKPEKLEEVERENKKEQNKSNEKGETPKLRRSLRLSKIPKKNKHDEKTPMKKLKRLDSKSKVISKR